MVSRQVLFAVAIGILLLSVGFFIWTLQQPSSNLAPVSSGSGSGKVMVNVVNPSGTPSITPSPSP